MGLAFGAAILWTGGMDTPAPRPSDPVTADTDDETIDLGHGWVEKDGKVVLASVEEILPQAVPTDGPAPLP